MSVKALAVELKEFHPIAGADRIQIARINGYNIVVGKDTKPGTQGLFFSTETPTAISDWFLKEHDLYRRLDKETGKNVSAGYFDSNGRVKAVKIRGVRSDGYFHQLNLKDYDLKVGDQIDTLNGALLCYKYYSQETLRQMKQNGGKAPVISSLPKHFETEHLRQTIKEIPIGATIIITEKYHGTSARTGFVPDAHGKWYDKLVKWLFGATFRRYYYVTGSRNVIVIDDSTGVKKDVDYHGETSYRAKYHNQIKIMGLHPGEIIFYEILGYTENGAPIMAPHQDGNDTIVYHYGNAERETSARVYRIAYLIGAKLIDIDYDRMCKRAAELNLMPVSELDRFIYDGDQDKLIKRVLALTEGNSTEGNHIKEGVVLDVYAKDYRLNRFVKQKSDAFCDLEGIMSAKDWYVDVESVS